MAEYVDVWVESGEPGKFGKKEVFSLGPGRWRIHRVDVEQAPPGIYVAAFSSGDSEILRVVVSIRAGLDNLAVPVQCPPIEGKVQARIACDEGSGRRVLLRVRAYEITED